MQGYTYFIIQNCMLQTKHTHLSHNCTLLFQGEVGLQWTSQSFSVYRQKGILLLHQIQIFIILLQKDKINNNNILIIHKNKPCQKLCIFENADTGPEAFQKLLSCILIYQFKMVPDADGRNHFFIKCSVISIIFIISCQNVAFR